MNKFLICASLTAALFGPAASAQSLVFERRGVGQGYSASGLTDITFSDNGRTLNIAGSDVELTEGTRIYVDSRIVEDNQVVVTFSGSSARVIVAGNISPFISATVSGANVVLTQSPDVSESTCGEITYILSGSSDNGSISLEGYYKSTIELRGLELTNPAGPAINIQNGKRIDLSIKNGTVNTLADGAGGDWKGCIVCKGHLELKGKGTLNVSGSTAHAIQAKEYIEMKNCTVNITTAVKDGINCNQYFLMESGNLTINNVGDDAVQASFKDNTDREPEDTGSITIAGGKIVATASANASKALKADGNITIAGGELELTVTGGGIWDSAKSKTKASACLSADGDMTVSDGTVTLKATGSGGKGMSCDGSLTISGGTISVVTSGGMYAYVNGTEYPYYTGNADRLTSDQKSSPKGIKADGAITISGGNISVVTSGNGGEGIESKSTLTVTDGKINVRAYDDAINSSSHMYISGGDITVIATNNDGLDSNGNLYISGGTIRAFGAGAPECGIDAAEEEGYTVFFTGGTLLAVGGSNSYPSKSDSTQPYVSTSASVTAGSTVELKDGSMTLASFTVPADYKGSASTGGGGRPGGWGGGGSTVMVTCPGLISGSSYTLTCGTSTSTVAARLTGSGGGFGPR